VTLYAGATILGNVTIGRNTIIGGNVWLLESVGPDTVVYQEGGKTLMHTAPADRGRMLGHTHGAGI
jgi:serine O-acetyltransferase